MFLRIFKSKPNPSTETDLLATYRQSGDMAILGKIFEPNMEILYAVCYKYLRDEEEAKDAVMQIFEQLITDLRKHEVKHLSGWLHTLARNHCLMKLRAKTDTEEIFEERFMELSDQNHLTTDWDLEDNLDRLDDCLKTLPADQKEAIILFFYEQKSYQQIVESTGFELNKVKSYLQNGKRNLKNCIEK
jgi:RNA polymerase sigma factor (sigma-70 family)